MQRDPALLTHATLPSAEAKWELARTSPDSPLPGKQQRVGHLFGHPLDVLQEDAPLPRGLAHVLAVVLRDEGGVGNHVLRRPFTDPRPLGPGHSHRAESPRSLDCMAARAQQGDGQRDV